MGIKINKKTKPKLLQRANNLGTASGGENDGVASSSLSTSTTTTANASVITIIDSSVTPYKTAAKRKLPLKPNSSLTATSKSLKQEPEKIKYGVTEFERKTNSEHKDHESESDSTTIIRRRHYVSDSESEPDQDAVDEFGAAFLRGLGYDEDEDEDKDKGEDNNGRAAGPSSKKQFDTAARNRRLGVTLGIGAKVDNLELVKELQSQEADIPLVKRAKK